MKKLEWSIIAGLAFIGFAVAALVTNNLIRFISLASSVLVPYFIVICPSLMNIKLRNQLKLSDGEVKVINVYMYTFSGLLAASILKSTYDYIIGDSTVIRIHG